MKYINITTRHHDSFCLWDTNYTDFKSTSTPAKRDLVAEFTEQCHKKGLGICYYYSYGRDWRHPHGVQDGIKGCRPQYDEPEPTYAYGKEHDMSIYVEFVNNQLKELLTNYGPITCIWFDAPPEVIRHMDIFKPQDTYDMIHRLQPHALISAKWGITGTEDFNAPETNQLEVYYEQIMKAQKKGVPLEICNTISNGDTQKKWNTRTKDLMG